MFKPLLCAALLASIANAVDAHEFWIDPIEFIVSPGDPVAADFRVGQNYEGSAYSFIGQRTRRHDMAFGDQVGPATARMGDRPAFTATAPDEDGLMTIIHVTADSRITWDDWADFESFVNHKAAEWALARHEERGLEKDGTTEIYSRYAKSLVAVGEGTGADRNFGLLTEIVALENPYTDDMSDGIEVQVFYDGTARASEQIEVFEKAPDGSVNVFTIKTDAEGRAVVPVQSGYRYQLDSVVLREISPQETGASWESLWANLTFQTP
jgi:uncharacterized GH25 family protein